MELSYDPAIPLLGIYQEKNMGIYPEKTIIRKDTHTLMFTAALFTIARTWKQPKHSLTDEWIKMSHTHTHIHTHTEEYYSAIKRMK